MKKYRFLLLGLFFLILFGFSSCNPEGSCLMICECNFTEYNRVDTVDLGGGYTNDECIEEADINDIPDCDCNGSWNNGE
jgi:hypothetical protein